MTSGSGYSVLSDRNHVDSPITSFQHRYQLFGVMDVASVGRNQNLKLVSLEAKIPGQAMSVLLTSTEKMSFLIQARSWTISLIETPHVVKSLASSAMPPGRSLTVTVNLTNLPSAAKPRSKHLPRIVVSILPPHNGITTLERSND